MLRIKILDGDNMKKDWWKSKAKWSGLLIGLAGAITLVASVIGGQIDVGTAVNEIIVIFTGLGIWGIRDAMH